MDKWNEVGGDVGLQHEENGAQQVYQANQINWIQVGRRWLVDWVDRVNQTPLLAAMDYVGVYR